MLRVVKNRSAKNALLTNVLYNVSSIFCVLCFQHPHVGAILLAVNLLAPAMFAFNLQLIPEDGHSTVFLQFNNGLYFALLVMIKINNKSLGTF